jgi:uncharacterized protein YndB with AHSA1/START domain
MSSPVREPVGASSVTTPTDREIRTERVFDAPRQRVWQAFTEPTLIARWWGRGNTLVVERMELERGGHWRYVEQTSDGAQGFDAALDRLLARSD